MFIRGFARRLFAEETSGEVGGGTGAGLGGAAPGAGAGGQAGGEAPPAVKTFTQEEFNKMLGTRLADERKKFVDFDKFKEAAAQLPKLEQKFQELQQQLDDAGKTADQRQQAAADRAAKAIERERAELQEAKSLIEKERDSWKGRYFEREISSSLASALDAQSITRDSRSDALALLRSYSKIDHNDDGKITAIELDGQSFLSVDDAVTAFLKTRPHMVSVKPAVGGGSRAPNASGSPTELANAPAEQLMAVGLMGRQQRR